MRKFLLLHALWAVWYSGMAQCPVQPAPLRQHFSSVSPGYIGGNCWHPTTSFPQWRAEDASGGDENTTGTGPWYDNTRPTQPGGIYIYYDGAGGSAGDTSGFMSPQIDLSALASPELSFAYHMYGAHIGSLEVQVHSGNSWDSVWAVNGQQHSSGAARFSKAAIDLSAYANSVIQVKFLATHGSGPEGEIAIDDVRIDEQSPCPVVTHARPDSVHSASADITWIAGSSGASAWEVQYDTAGFSPGSGTTLSLSTDSAHLSGLTGSTLYHVYIREDCGNNVFSNWEGPLEFKTLCAASVNSYFTDFDNDQTSRMPDCWSQYNNYSVSANAEVQSPSHRLHRPVSSPNLLNINSGNGYVTGDTMMVVSPQFSGLSAGDKQVRFSTFSTKAENELYVGTTSSQAPGSPITYLDTIPYAEANTWEEVVVYLTTSRGYNGSDEYVVLQHSLDAVFSHIRIDNFYYEPIPACPKVYQVQQAGATDSSVSIGFNSLGTVLDLQWGPVGFNQGSGCITTINTGNQAVVTLDSVPSGCNFPLQPNSSYQVYVRTNCTSSGNGFSGWEGPFTVATACAPFSAPYYSGFETDTLDEAPVCWSNYLVGPYTASGAVEVVDFQSPFGGLQHVQLFNADNDTTLLISPEFDDITAGDKRVTFYARTTSSSAGNHLVVGTISSPGNVASFNPIDTITLNTQDLQYTVDLTAANGYNGSDKYVAFFHAADDIFRTYFIDDFRYEVIPACLAPSINSLHSSSVKSGSAAVGWASGSAGAKTYITWGPVGFVPGATGSAAGTDSVAGTVDSYQITGLSSQTTYEVYIRDSCAASGLSPWIGPLDFTTLCGVSPAPFVEDFDGSVWSSPHFSCWNSDPSFTALREPFRWVQRMVGPGSNNGPQSDLTGGNFMYVEANGSAAGDTASLVSPLIDLGSLSAPALYFWQHRYHSNLAIADMDIEVSNDGGGSWSRVYSVSGLTQTAVTDPWREVVVDLRAYAGDTINLRFLQISNGCCGDAAIDSVAVAEGPSCFVPSSLQANNVTDTSAYLSWSPADPNAAHELWFGPQGFHQGSQTAAGVKTVLNSSSHLAGSLSDTACYEFLVRSICGPGDTSEWAGPVSFCTECPATAMPYTEDFNSWPLTCWYTDLGNHPWGHQTATGGNGYLRADFQNQPLGSYIMTSPQVMLSQNAEVAFDWSHLYTSFNPDDELAVRVTISGTGVWDTILHLKGSDFNDATASYSAPGTFVSEHLLLNPAVYTGHLVQVQFWANTGYGASLFIDNFSIAAPPTCPVLSDLDTARVTQNSATIYWTDHLQGSATDYEVEYGMGAFGSAGNTKTMVTADSLHLTGLNAGTGYCFWVREICSVGDTSQWAGPFCFSTPCATLITAPYHANFEGVSIGHFPAYDNCWENAGTSAPYWASEDASGQNEHTANTGPLYDHTHFGSPGGTYIFMESTSAGPTPVDLTTPWIDVSSLNSPQLSFWYFMHGASMGKLEVLVDSGTGFFLIDSLVGEQQSAQTDPWGQRAISLGAYSDSLRIAFRGHVGLTWLFSTSDIALDDISISEQASCPDPVNLHLTTNTATSAGLSWNASGNAQSYEIEYGSPGFTPGTGIRQSVSGTATVITSLVHNLVYEAYVRAYCAPGDTSNWAGPVKLHPAPSPCDSLEAYSTGLLNQQSSLFLGWTGDAGDAEISTAQAQSGTRSLHIYDSGPAGFSNAVAVLDSSYSSGIHDVEISFYLPPGSNGYYSLLHQYDGYSSVWAAEVYLEHNGTAVVSRGQNGAPLGSYSFNIGTWNTVVHRVDFDNDTAWVVINGATTTLGWQWSAPRTTFSNSLQAVNFRSNTNAVQPADAYFDDFCISPYTAPACAAPGSLSASYVGCADASISWVSPKGNPQSLVEYGPTGFLPGSGAGTLVMASSGDTINGLSPGTGYDVWIADTCIGDTSIFAGPLLFTTDTMPAPVASFTSNHGTATASGVIVGFNGSGSTGASHYSWDFGDGNSANGFNPTHTYTANGTYYVTLTVSGACGTDSIQDTLVIRGIGLDDNVITRSLEVYPNPSANHVNVRFDAGDSDEARISIMDLSGKIVISLEADDHNGHFDEAIDLRQLAGGTYMLKIESGGITAIRRIVKQ